MRLEFQSAAVLRDAPHRVLGNAVRHLSFDLKDDLEFGADERRAPRAPSCSLSKNRLKNRFNFRLSNGAVPQVLDRIGAPEEIRTPDRQIRSLKVQGPRVSRRHLL